MTAYEDLGQFREWSSLIVYRKKMKALDPDPPDNCHCDHLSIFETINSASIEFTDHTIICNECGHLLWEGAIVGLLSRMGNEVRE